MVLSPSVHDFILLLLQEKEINKYKSEVLPKYLRSFDKQAGEKGYFVGDDVSSLEWYAFI